MIAVAYDHESVPTPEDTRVASVAPPRFGASSLGLADIECHSGYRRHHNSVYVILGFR